MVFLCSDKKKRRRDAGTSCLHPTSLSKASYAHITQQGMILGHNLHFHCCHHHFFATKLHLQKILPYPRYKESSMAGDLNPISSRSDDLPDADHSQRNHAQQSSAFVHQAEERSASPSHRSQNTQRLTSFSSYLPIYQRNFDVVSKIMPHDSAQKLAEKYTANTMACDTVGHYLNIMTITGKKYFENGLVPKEDPTFIALSDKVTELLRTATELPRAENNAFEPHEPQDIYNKLDEIDVIAQKFYKHTEAVLDKQKEKNSEHAL